jgi:hypothetical protein
MEMSMRSRDGDIQVVTDISVRVEGGSGRLSVWKPPASTCGFAGNKGIESDDDESKMLRKEVGQMV